MSYTYHLSTSWNTPIKTICFLQEPPHDIGNKKTRLIVVDEINTLILCSTYDVGVISRIVQTGAEIEYLILWDRGKLLGRTQYSEPAQIVTERRSQREVKLNRYIRRTS